MMSVNMITRKLIELKGEMVALAMLCDDTQRTRLIKMLHETIELVQPMKDVIEDIKNQIAREV
jgi:hypothetical protein